MAKKGSSGTTVADQARMDEQARQQRVREGTAKIDETFGKSFTDDFYSGRQKAYSDYATPQLEKQYADAQRELTFALDRAGLLNSSVRSKKEADLAELLATQKQAIADKGLGYANTARNNVESARGELITALNSSGDATAAANSAANRVAALSAADTYSPLSGLFTGFTNALNTQAALEKAAAYSYGAVKPTYSTGLFGPSSGSVVTRN